MKNKYISYILLVFIVFLGFSSKVEADVPELTCVYEGFFWGSDAIMFVQYNNRIELWRHSGEDKPSVNDNGWKIYNNASFYSDSQYYGYQNNKAFSACPKYADYSGSTFYFYDDENSMYYDVILPVFPSHHERIYESKGEAVDVPEVIIDDYDDEVDYNYSNFENLDCSSLNDRSDWLVDRDTDTYDMACLYSAAVDGQCVLVQLEYNNSDVKISSNHAVQSDGIFQTSDILDKYGSEFCPINLYYTSLKTPNGVNVFSFSLTGDYDSRFSMIKSTNSVNDVEIQFQKIEIVSCTDLVGEEIASYLKFAFTALKIAIPLILIGLGVVDFARGVFSGEEEMKKIQQKFIKRIILGIAIFLIPVALSLLIDIVETVFGIGIDTCELF